MLLLNLLLALHWLAVWLNYILLSKYPSAFGTRPLRISIIAWQMERLELRKLVLGLPRQQGTFNAEFKNFVLKVWGVNASIRARKRGQPRALPSASVLLNWFGSFVRTLHSRLIA